VLWFHTTMALLVSQCVWALSFCAIFIVPAVLYRLMPPEHFQLVASINNCAMLCASLSASLVGFVLSEVSPNMVCGSSTSTDQYEVTFYISLGSACVSTAVLVFVAAAGWFPTGAHGAGPLGERASWSGYVQQLLNNLRSGQFLLWLGVSAVARGVHTQVVTLWPLISMDIAPACEMQSFNALISFGAYLCAALVVLLPAHFSAFTSLYGHFAIPPCFLICSVLLLAIASADSLLGLASLLVVYHSLSELMLTIASAKIAASIITVPSQSQQTELQYMSAMSLKYLASLAVQTVSMLIIWPRWGGLDNVFGLQLSVRDQFSGLACMLVIVFCISMLGHCRQVAIGSQCANYEHVARG